MSVIGYAREALLALAEDARGREWAGQLDGAMIAAANAGWPWERYGLYACRLIFTPDAHPHDLREITRNPLDHTPPGVSSLPTEEWRAARAALAARRGDAA